jgi:hypothetical protein
MSAAGRKSGSNPAREVNRTGRPEGRTHAQTWEPVSGMTVKRAVSSSSRTQAIFSSEESAAVSSAAQCQHSKG